MGTSNGRFLLGLLIGALIGGLLTHFLAGAPASSQAVSAGLSPGLSLSPVATIDSADELPASVANQEREVARAQPASVQVAPLSDAEVKGLMAGLTKASATRSAGSGSISGHVLDGAGEPLAGVVLRLRAEVLRTPGTKTSAVGAAAPTPDSLQETVRKAAERYNEQRANLRELETDASGSYHFSNLADNKWTISAYLSGYIVKANSSSRSLSVGAEVDFTGNEVIEIPTAVLRPGGASATTANLRAEFMTGSGSTRAASYAWSEEEAYLRLIPGEYEITAYSPYSGSVKSAELSSEPQKIKVASGASLPSLIFELRGRPGIAGLVHPAEGDPQEERLRVRLMSLAPGEEVDLERLAHSETTAYSRPGMEYTFPDLEPGRYVVGAARGWNSPILQHRIVEVGHTKVQCDLDLPALDLSQMLRATVLDSSGTHLNGVRFSLEVKRSTGSRSSRMSSLRDKDGSYLLEFDTDSHKALFGDEASGAEFKLQATHKDFGPQSIEITRGQTEVSLTFVSPGSLEVSVAGYQGSGYEGRLSVRAMLTSEIHSGMYYSSRGQSGLNGEGVQVIENLTPGSYTVALSVSAKESNQNWFRSSELDSIEMEILAGENTLQIQIPTLYGLRVHAVDAKQGADITAARVGSDNPYGRGYRASFDANGYAYFRDLRSGDYTLYAPGGQMNITVPRAEVEFEAMVLNALRVTISNREGELAKLGFQSGDLVIGRDGEEFGEEPDLGLFSKLMTSKSLQVNLLVLRGSKRLEVLVKGSEIGDWQTMGGNMTPAAY